MRTKPQLPHWFASYFQPVNILGERNISHPIVLNFDFAADVLECVAEEDISKHDQKQPKDNQQHIQQHINTTERSDSVKKIIKVIMISSLVIND